MSINQHQGNDDKMELDSESLSKSIEYIKEAQTSFILPPSWKLVDIIKEMMLVQFNRLINLVDDKLQKSNNKIDNFLAQSKINNELKGINNDINTSSNI